MTDIEDAIELHEAKGIAYDEGFVTGLLTGIPVGTVVTLIIMALTHELWLPLFK